MERKPPITVSSLDLARLEALLDKLPRQSYAGREALQEELLRADVREPEDMPADVVTMNSTVQCTLLENGQSMTLTLVYPRDADGSADRISVLAPIGSALLGLSVGQQLAWPTTDGKAVTVRVDAILYQPESAGELHR